MDFLKTVAGKVVGGLVALAVVAGGDLVVADGRRRRAQMLLGGTGKIVGWLGVVLLVPWATFFVIGRVGEAARATPPARRWSLAYTADRGGAAGVAVRLVDPRRDGVDVFCRRRRCSPAVYNLFACDWIAEKVAEL